MILHSFGQFIQLLFVGDVFVRDKSEFLAGLLKLLINAIATHLKVGMCSIYIFEFRRKLEPARLENFDSVIQLGDGSQVLSNELVVLTLVFLEGIRAFQSDSVVCRVECNQGLLLSFYYVAAIGQ